MQLGEKQLLKVVKKVEFGVYLGEEDSEERVLLPICLLYTSDAADE